MPIQIPSTLRLPTGRFKRLLAGLVIGLVTVHPAALARHLGSPGNTITVNTTVDGYILTLPGKGCPAPCAMPSSRPILTRRSGAVRLAPKPG